MADSRMREFDQQLTGARLRHVEGFDFGADFAGLVVDGGVILLGDLLGISGGGGGHD